jgi:hypothetical protein
METKKFLTRTLGDDGYYCVFAAKDGRKLQKFYPTLEAVVNAAGNFDSEGFDTYFALATFQDDTARVRDNVRQMRSFYLDLDCGPEKEFPTQEAAIKELRAFCKSVGLPRPTMVNSGNGVHVYWPLTQPVSLAEWFPHAQRLKNLCKEKGFDADKNVTADAARILRVPGTHNYKRGERKPVALLGTLSDPVDFDAFTTLLGSDPAPLFRPNTGPVERNAVMDALIGNRESVFKKIVIKTAEGKGCAQIGALLTKPETVPEPLWRAGLSIAKFCSDGYKAAHRMSKGHPEYDPDVTDRKVEGIKGPYLCTRFDEHNPGVCAGCPNWGKIKSPIVLGQQVREATDEDNVVQAPPAQAAFAPSNVTYLIPKYPRPYFRGANGGVYLRKVDEDGEVEEKCIYHNDLYVIRRVRDPESGEGIVMRLHLPHDPVKEFTVPLTAVGSRDDFRKQMSAQGVGVLKMDDLMSYTMQWVNELQAVAKADEARRQFGWVDEDCSSFVLGNREYFHDREGDNPPSTTTMAMLGHFQPKGSLQGWKDTMSFYARPGFELHQYVVAAGFGSVLMQFLPIHAAGLHLYSKDSGLGKTTAMLAALSIWGKPDKLILGQNDTYNYKMMQGEMYHNLPFMLDEVTNMSGRELSDMVYQLTGGMQKGRMSSGSNTARHRGEPWKLLAVTTGNASVIERISMAKAMPKAEAQRMLEVRVDRIFSAPSDKSETDNFAKAVIENCGWAGPIFVQHIMRNRDTVKALLLKVQERIDKAAGLTAENRFWSAHTACSLTGAILAGQLGLVQFDTKNLFNWIISTLLAENKRTSFDMVASVEDTLNDYINEHWGSFLWIKSTEDLRGKVGNGNGIDSLVVPEVQPKGKLVGRYETDVKRVYLVPKFLKAWCGEQQINYSAFVQELITKMGGKKMKARLAKGTHMNLPATDVIMVECDVKIAEGATNDGSAA